MELIDRLLELAQIAANESDRAAFAADIESVLQFVEPLRSIDTSGVEPLVSPVEGYQELRADELRSDVEPAELLSLGAATRDGSFIVPQVVKKKP